MTGYLSKDGKGRGGGLAAILAANVEIYVRVRTLQNEKDWGGEDLE